MNWQLLVFIIVFDISEAHFIASFLKCDDWLLFLIFHIIVNLNIFWFLDCWSNTLQDLVCFVLFCKLEN